MTREGRRNWQIVLHGLMLVQKELDILRLLLSRAARGGIMAKCGSKGRGRSLEASDVDHPWRYSWSRSALGDAFILRELQTTHSYQNTSACLVVCLSLLFSPWHRRALHSATQRSSQRTCLCATVPGQML
jgi:hypothetical protein